MLPYLQGAIWDLGPFTEKLRRNFLDAESWKLSVAQCSRLFLFEVMFEFFNPHDFMKYWKNFQSLIETKILLHLKNDVVWDIPFLARVLVV